MFSKIQAYRPDSWTILLGAILLCAAVARVGWPGIAEFKYDEAMISRRAIALAQQGIWPASTISSIPGIPQPPIKALLLAIPYAFTRSPLAAVVFQGILGTITVGLAYWIGARYFSRRAGLVASAVMALAPWALFYDRKLWSQDVPVFTALMMIGLFAVIVERRRWGLALACGALGLLIGFYLGDAILAGVVGLSVVCFPRAVFSPAKDENRRSLVIWSGAALAILIVTLSPYLIELRERHSNPSAAGSEAVGENTNRVFDPLGQLAMSARVTTGFDFHALAGDKAAEFDSSLPANLNGPLDGTAMWVIMAAMVYVAVKAIVEAVKARREVNGGAERGGQLERYALLAIWLFVPVAAWTAFRQMPYPHRYIMAYPSQALALGVMLDDGWRWLGAQWPSSRRLLAIGIPGAIVALGVWHAVVWGSMLRFVETTAINGGHGAPVERLWAAAEQARALAGPERKPVVIHTDGDDPEYQGGAAEFDAVLGDLPIVLIKTPGIEVLPAGEFVWVNDRGGGRYEVAARQGPPTSSEAGLARLENGIDLLSVKQEPGKAGSITLTWRVWHGAPDSRDYGFSAQLYDAGGAKLGQVDTPFLRSPYWRMGDTITTRVEAPISGEAVTGGTLKLVVAMYAYVSETQIQPVNILDVAGNPAGQQVTVELK